MPIVRAPLLTTAAPSVFSTSPLRRVRVPLLVMEPLSLKALRLRVMFLVLVNCSSASVTREIISPLDASLSAAVMER